MIRPHLRRSHAPSSRPTTSADGRRWARRAGALLATGALLVGGAGAASAAGTSATTPAAGAAAPTASAGVPSPLGPHTIVFDPSMSTASIQATLDSIAAQQVTDQFGPQRYAVLFAPGTYGTAAQPLNVEVGYYTEVAGLGTSPDAVTINGTIGVFDQGGNALDNFWRSLSNLHINVTSDSAKSCHTTNEFWAASQAAPVRRVDVTGSMTLFDYCGDANPYSSGGFIADSRISGQVISGSQQQYYARNTDLVGGWSNGVWNQVFSGDPGAPAQSFGTGTNPYTTLATTPVSKEEPFLTVDARGAYSVVVPAARTSSTGTDWTVAGTTGARTLPLQDFFVATPSDSVAKINAALALGKDLLLTPGVYQTKQPINVIRPGTVVLGLGLATIEPVAGNVAIRTLDVPGVDLAGMIIDAGPKDSPVLVQVGTPLSQLDGELPHPRLSSASDPTALQDVFFRIGGAHLGRATRSLVVDSNQVVVDDTWAWRADHGASPADVGWTVNTADNGLTVNGDDVTATGLFVEHYQKDEVVWNGERGRTVFFQNEMPYDAPDQAAWQLSPSHPGYPAYTVAKGVKTHEAWGAGSYIYTDVVPTLHSANAFEVPVAAGVRMHDLLTVSLDQAGTIDHVINGVGAPVTPDVQGPSNVVAYPAG